MSGAARPPSPYPEAAWRVGRRGPWRGGPWRGGPWRGGPWRRGRAREAAGEDAGHLKRAAQLWDLSLDHHLEVAGPGADALMRHLTPRDLAAVPEGRRAYAPVCGPSGGMLGDPMVMRLAPDRWWLSGAADLGGWLRALAAAVSPEVRLRAPDLHPLAVQGPLAEEVAAAVFGEAVRALPPQGWARLPWSGGAAIVARSDLSREGGFEILQEGRSGARPLWDALTEGGAPFDLRAARPSAIARIEGGLLLWGVDIGPDLTPFEAGLGRLCDGAHDHVGRAALKGGCAPARGIRPVEIDGPPLAPPPPPWPLLAGRSQAGRVTSAAWAPEHGLHVALALVACEHGLPGARLSVEAPSGRREARVREAYWS